MSYRPISEDTGQVRDSLAALLRAFAARQEPPPLAPGIGPWIAHLLWLRSSLEAGTLAASELLAPEAEGLRLMDEVSREVSQKLRRCPRCGHGTEALLNCDVCGHALQPGHNQDFGWRRPSGL